jgi:hypothetical protein
MRKGKRSLQKELNEALTIPDDVLAVIMDAKNIEYYMLRSVECIHTAIDSLGNGNVYRELDKAILLLAIAKREIKKIRDDVIKSQ